MFPVTVSPMAIRAGPSLRQVLAAEEELPLIAAPPRLISPLAWNPLSQNMSPVTVSPPASRARPPLPSRCAPLRMSWPLIAAPPRLISPAGLESLVAEHASDDGEPGGGQGGFVLAVQRRAAELEDAIDAGAVQADLPVAENPMSQNMPRPTVIASAVRARPSLPSRSATLKPSWPPTLAPSR